MKYVLRILLLLFFVSASAPCFADDEKPAKESGKDMRESINKAAKNADKEVRKGVKNTRKRVNKPWKKAGEDNRKKTKD
jgi:translation initiation factor RLI1